MAREARDGDREPAGNGAGNLPGPAEPIASPGPLENARKHAAQRGETYAPGYVDPYSSAGAPDLALPPAQTWLLRTGWKRAGP